MGLGIRNKISHVKEELGIRLQNSFGKPDLFDRRSPERIGAAFLQPSDMCEADRIMLYALVRGLRPERVLEIGVRWGSGARIISAALQDAGSGRAIGIDPDTSNFRPEPAELFNRYALLEGYSPQAIPDAVKRLGGKIDFVMIDAMHTHDHVLADFSGVIPFLAPGAHVLLHDAFHTGIDAAIREVLEERAELIDCGFLTRHPHITDAPVAYHGLRLIRNGESNSRRIIAQHFDRADFSPSLFNWDHYWNRIKDQ